MGFFDYFLHVCGFIAPAVALALLMPGAGRLLIAARGPRYWVQSALGAAVGVAVLLAGLWFFGRDGKMTTYAALVAAIALAQWGLSAGWRR